MAELGLSCAFRTAVSVGIAVPLGAVALVQQRNALRSDGSSAASHVAAQLWRDGGARGFFGGALVTFAGALALRPLAAGTSAFVSTLLTELPLNVAPGIVSSVTSLSDTAVAALRFPGLVYEVAARLHGHAAGLAAVDARIATEGRAAVLAPASGLAATLGAHALTHYPTVAASAVLDRVVPKAACHDTCALSRRIHAAVTVTASRVVGTTVGHAFMTAAVLRAAGDGTGVVWDAATLRKLAVAGLGARVAAAAVESVLTTLVGPVLGDVLGSLFTKKEGARGISALSMPCCA